MSDISVKLALDIQGAVKSIQSFTEQAQTSFGRLEQSVSSVGAALTGVASFLFFDQIKQGFATVISAASEAEEAQFKLAKSLKVTGESSVEAMASFIEFAAEIQRTTRYDDDLIISQIAVAKRFKATNEEAKELIKAAIELSQVTGDDLDTSVKNLGLSLSGKLIKGLSNAIPELRGLTAEQLRAGAAIETLNQQLSGGAAASVSTFKGQVTQASNEVSNLSENLGDMIIKDAGIKSLVTTFRDFVRTVNESKGLQVTVAALAAGVGTIGAVAAAFGGLAAAMSIANAIAITFGTSLAIALGPIGLVSAALAGLAATFVAFRASADNSPMGIFNQQVIKAKENIADLEDRIKRIQSGNTASLLQRGLTVDLSKTKMELEDARKSLRMLEQQAPKTGKAIENTFKDITGKVRRELDAQREEYVKYLEKIKSEFESLKERLDTFNRDDREQVMAKYNLELQKLNELLSARKISEQEYSEYSEKLAFERSQKLFDLEKKRMESLTANPLKFLTDGGKIENGRDVAGFGLSGIRSALGGEDGAKSLISDGIGAIADTLLPGIGNVVSDIIGVLSQGPEKVQQFIEGFVRAAPQLIKGIIQSLPVLIRELAKGFKELVKEIPAIVQAFIEEIPNIIAALIESIPYIAQALIEQGPNIIVGIFRGFGSLIGGFLESGFKKAFDNFALKMLKLPEDLINAIVEGLKEALKGITDISGGMLGGDTGGGRLLRSGVGAALLGPVGGVLGGLGFAKGGLVPEGYPDDTYPARLTSGELVVPRQATKDFKEFMADSRGGGTSQDSELVAKVSALTDVVRQFVEKDQKVYAEVKLADKAFASILLDLSRRGLRTS